MSATPICEVTFQGPQQTILEFLCSQKPNPNVTFHVKILPSTVAYPLTTKEKQQLSQVNQKKVPAKKRKRTRAATTKKRLKPTAVKEEHIVPTGGKRRPCFDHRGIPIAATPPLCDLFGGSISDSQASPKPFTEVELDFTLEDTEM